MLSQVAPLPAPGATGPFKVVLINPYELGRQPFALAEPAAWLKREGFAVTCLDLSLQKLDPEILEDAGLAALYVGMHTATRIAVQALPRIKRLAPKAHLCVFGLYAPMNEALLRRLGVGTVLGGELEPTLLSLCQRLRANGTAMIQSEPVISLGRVPFVVPDRSVLPKLSRYAHLVLPDGSTRVAGFAEGSRGCKHLCRHCPVVPVYQGRFRIVPVDVVMEDIRQQVKEGATHISFGDPDFFNGPTHGLRLARALHAAFPRVTFDATIKIQHLIDHAELLPELRASGCLFITSAVEAVDDDILRHLAKNHTSRDFDRAVALTREAGIALAPTFVAFTPWTKLDGYIALLERLEELRIVESVPPVQLTIRLLVPEGSYLLQLPGFKEARPAASAHHRLPQQRFSCRREKAGRGDRGCGQLLPPTGPILGPASHHGAPFRPAGAGGGHRPAGDQRQPGCRARGGRFGSRACGAAVGAPWPAGESRPG